MDPAQAHKRKFHLLTDLLKYVFAASLGAISYLLVSVHTPSQLSPGGLSIKCSHRGM